MRDRMIRLLTVGFVTFASACMGPTGETPSPPVTRGGGAFGPPDSLILWRGDRQVAAYRNLPDIFPTRTIEAGGDPLPLPSRPADFSSFSFEAGGETYDLDRFIEDTRIAGLLVLKNGEIALERYALGNNASSRWVSYSISKSVVSLLMGAALRDGYIRDLEDSVADYLPILEGTVYEAVTLRDALQMASGVEWTDGYNALDTNFNRSLTMPTLEQLRGLGARERVAVPGERFNYNSAETHLLGTVLRAAIGNNLATYLSQKIWRPFGMEADGNWMLVESNGGEHGGCCFSATLRDYGRLGLFAMRGGVLPTGERVLADGWMEASLTPSQANPGYGYLWWLRGEGAFAAIGIFGQVIWVDPAEDLVIVTHGAWPQASALYGRVYAFAEAVREAL
jgi:CubicO group peptidase (beta-lactamase class C family)